MILTANSIVEHNFKCSVNRAILIGITNLANNIVLYFDIWVPHLPKVTSAASFIKSHTSLQRSEIDGHPLKSTLNCEQQSDTHSVKGL